MTISDALALVDELKPNQIDRARKIEWLSEIDHRVFIELFARHERDENTPDTFTAYSEDTSPETVLLVPEPYSTLYRWYLEMQIDLANMEMGKYNNSMLLFQNAWQTFAVHYHRTHMPLTTTAWYTY